MSLLRNFTADQSRPPVVQSGPVRVDVVSTLDEFVAVMTIRARVFQNEQDCPYGEEFDGNDLSGATHLLARRNGEPVGTMRLRWFAGFAKSERFAVVPEGRATQIAFVLIEAACLVSARKGYRKILGHAQKRVAPFWIRRGGGYLRQDRPSFFFSDHEYVEIIREIDPPENHLNLDSPPLELCRPEGDWDREGVLERSAKRAA